MKKTLIAFAFASVAASAFAQAPGGGGGGGFTPPTFEALDADKNGSVSKAEFDARPRQGGGGPPPGGQAPR